MDTLWKNNNNKTKGIRRLNITALLPNVVTSMHLLLNNSLVTMKNTEFPAKRSGMK